MFHCLQRRERQTEVKNTQKHIQTFPQCVDDVTECKRLAAFVFRHIILFFKPRKADSNWRFFKDKAVR